jgi:hypothetical protein
MLIFIGFKISKPDGRIPFFNPFFLIAFFNITDEKTLAQHE